MFELEAPQTRKPRPVPARGFTYRSDRENLVLKPYPTTPVVPPQWYLDPPGTHPSLTFSEGTWTLEA